MKQNKGVEYMCNTNQDCQCISDILKIILILQKKTPGISGEMETCDKKTLGCKCTCKCKCNTRPVQLFLVSKNGDEPLVMPTTRGPINETTEFSNIFRIEKLDNCCATFRVLELAEANNHNSDCILYTATNSFFTLDLRCVCAIRCLDDTFVKCVC